MSSTIILPSHYAGAVYDRPGEISTKVVELELPSPGIGEVLINLTHSGVCHSDLSIMKNGWKLSVLVPNTQVGGHEGVGTIVQVGEGADVHGFGIGDRVGIKWLRDTCGTCEHCLAGDDGLCAKQSASGLFQPGTFQQYVTAPARYLTPIPDKLSSELAAPMLCAGMTAYAALRKRNTKPGEWMVVSGAGGGVGHLVTQLAAKAFGQRVIGIDQASKGDVVKRSGAEVFLDVMKVGQDLPAEVKRCSEGLGVHTVIVCAASNMAYAQGVDFLRPGGTMIGIGMPSGDPTPIATAMPSLIVQKQLKIVGSILGNRQDAIDVLELAARGVITLHHEVRKLGDLTDTFRDLDSGSLAGRVVLDLRD